MKHLSEPCDYNCAIIKTAFLSLAFERNQATMAIVTAARDYCFASTVLLLAALLFASCGGDAASDEGSDGDSSSGSGAASSDQAVEISAMELYEAFNDDPVQASIDYGTKTLIVSGEVYTVNENRS